MNAALRTFAAALAVALAAAGLSASRPSVAIAAPDDPPKGVLTKAPRLVKFVEADYPSEEKAAGLTGTVKLRITIDARGAVTAVEVAEPATPRFDAAALAAARQFVFEPAEVDGAPAEVSIVYAYVFKIDVAAPTVALFSGTVRDRATGAPIASAVVTLGDGKTATTDPSGHFSIADIAPGAQSVSIARPGSPPVLTEETFVAGEEVKALYDLESPPEEGTEPEEDLEVVVTAPKLVKAVTSVEVKNEEARRVPGTQGDVLQVVQNLPGVARAAAGSGQLVVWGAAPEDTRVYVEGIRVPLLYHYGGVRSVIHSDFVRSVDLVAGGYGATHGRGLGGIVTVSLAPLDDPGFHGSSEISVLDYAGSVRAGAGDVFRSAAAFRYGFLDRLVPLVTETDIGELFPVPAYFDAQARVQFRPSPSTSIEIGGFGASDAVQRDVPSGDPLGRQSDARSLRWGRGYVRITRTLDDGAQLSITPWFGRDERALAQSFGGVETSVTSGAWIAGARASLTSKLVDAPKNVVSSLQLSGGFDGEVTASDLGREGSLGSPAREGDRRVFGEAPSDGTARDTWSVVTGSPAVWGEADIGFFADALHVVVGARVDPYFSTTSRLTPQVGDTPSIGGSTSEPFLEPRVAIRWAPSDRLELRAAYGLYHQPAAPDDLSSVFGTPTLGASTGHHALAGAKADLFRGLNVDVVAYATLAEDLATRSALDSPRLAAALDQVGQGRSFGAQLLLRKEREAGFFGWVSYGIARSERRDTAAGRWRPFDFDQTHVLTAVASYDIWKGLEIGARFRVATGFPRTPVEGAYYDAKSDAYRPILGEPGGTRLPTFYQLDVRVSKTFRVSDVELETYLDVQNVTNHANVEEYVYSLDYGAEGAITGTPILPVLGVRSSW